MRCHEWLVITLCALCACEMDVVKVSEGTKTQMDTLCYQKWVRKEVKRKDETREKKDDEKKMPTMKSWCRRETGVLPPLLQVPLYHYCVSVNSMYDCGNISFFFFFVL